MARCPACLQEIPRGIDAATLLRLLKDFPERYVYKGQDNNWYITRTQNSRVQYAGLKALIESGALRRKYSDLDEAWTTGRTIDVRSTLAARKAKKITRCDVIFTDPSP